MTRQLLLVGDSIANGFGLRGQPSYGQLVADSLGLELVDLTGLAMRVNESLELVRANSDLAPAIALIAHGITEPIPRPIDSRIRWLPARYRRHGWLDPRPWYSDRPMKAILDRAESAVRWRLKNLVMKHSGTMQVLDIEDYAESLTELVETLCSRGSRVVVIGPTDLSDRYFPGAGDQMRLYANASHYRPDVELAGILDRWGDFLADRFHPNPVGHRKIARALLASL